MDLNPTNRTKSGKNFDDLTKHKPKKVQSVSAMSPLKSPPKSKISTVINMLFGNFENDGVIKHYT